MLELKKNASALIIIRNILLSTIIALILAIGLNFLIYLFQGTNSAGLWYNKYWIGFFFIIFIVLELTLVLSKHIGKNPEYLYLAIVLLITVFVCWSQSTLEYGSDNSTHFYNMLIASIGQGEIDITHAEQVMTETILIANGLGTTPDNYIPTLESLYFRNTILNGWDSEIVDTAEQESLFQFTFISYFPFSFVYDLCSALGVPFSIKFFLAKLPSPIIYSLLTFLGMRQLKCGKMIYAIIALLPITLMHISNYHYFYWTSGLILMGLGYLVGIIQKKSVVPKRKLIIMLLTLMTACIPRLVYFPIILLCLLVPRKCFKTNKETVIYRVSVIACCLLVASLFFIPTLFGDGLGEGDTRGGSDISPTRQLAFILENPIEYIKTFAKFVIPFYSQNIDGQIMQAYLNESSLPRFFADYIYLDYRFSDSLYLAYSHYLSCFIIIALLIFSVITDRSEDVVYGKWPGIVSILLCIVIGSAVITYMYLAFNNVGARTIKGIQTRYVVPLLYPSLAFLGYHKWGERINKRIPANIYNGVVLVLMFFIFMVDYWTVYLRFLN